MNSLKVAIIGAGPAGCALARILSQSDVSPSLSVTIFEGEKSLDVRSQGGTLDLRQGTGLDAIRAANLIPEFDKYARYEGESFLLCDKYLKKYFANSGKEDNKDSRAPEIDRFRLRQILLDSIPSSTIRWGKRLRKISEERQGDSFKLQFTDGTSANGFDLVVGADGAWSKVRPLLSDAQPAFSGVGGWCFTISDASKVAPESVKLINRGNVMAQHDHIMFGQQQMGDDVIQVNAWYIVDDGDENWVEKAPYDISDFEAVKKFVLDEKLKKWDPLLKNSIAKCNSANTQLRSVSLHLLPTGHNWKHRKGVTLIGDAAHLMTPFAGEGVNQGLTDAKVLAREIIKAVSSASSEDNEELEGALDSAVTVFEKEMFARMKPIMEMTEKMKENIIFKAGGLYKNIETWLLTVMTDDLPLQPITVPIATIAAYVYYFFFRLWNKPKP